MYTMFKDFIDKLDLIKVVIIITLLYIIIYKLLRFVFTTQVTGENTDSDTGRHIGIN